MKNSERLLDFFTKAEERIPDGQVIFIIHRAREEGNLIKCMVSARIESDEYMEHSRETFMIFHKDMYPPEPEQIMLNFGINKNLVHPDQVRIIPAPLDRQPRERVWIL